MNCAARGWLLALPLALMLGTVACGTDTSGPNNSDGGSDGGSKGDGGGGGNGDGGTPCPTPLNQGCGTGGVDYQDLSGPTATRTVTFESSGSGGTYNPRCITIAKGQSVTFQGNGTNFANHNMSQTCGPVGMLIQASNNAAQKTVTFSTPGDYGYRCDFHFAGSTLMSGAIRVLP